MVNFSGLEVSRNKLESSLPCCFYGQGASFGTSVGAIKQEEGFREDMDVAGWLPFCAVSWQSM